MENIEPPPPSHMVIPDQFVIKPSDVDPKRLGVWCKETVTKGTKFGPFIGFKTTEYQDEMDPIYVWEVVDQANGKFIHFIDATDPMKANWMRYINCARFFEEQNMVSQQEGTEIHYKTIKDVGPGEELLTWYETKFTQKRGRKKGTKKGAKKKPRSRSNSNDSGQSGISSSSSRANRSKHKSESQSNSMVLTQSVKDHFSHKDSSDGNAVTETDQVDDNDIDKDSSDTEADSQASDDVKFDAPTYQFDIQEHHVIKSRLGRSVYRCDVCSGIYRHAFSLKRHFLRNHVNYKYLSKADLVNCNVAASEISKVLKESRACAVVDLDERKLKQEVMEDVNESSSVADDVTDAFFGSEMEQVTIKEDDLQLKLESSSVDQNSNDEQKREKEDFASESQTVSETSGSLLSASTSNVSVVLDPSMASEIEGQSDSDKGPILCSVTGKLLASQLNTEDSIASSLASSASLASETSLQSVKATCDVNFASNDLEGSAEDSKSTPMDTSAPFPNGSSQTGSYSASKVGIASQDGSNKPAPQPPSGSQGSAMPGVFKCHICSNLFDRLLELKTHMSHHPGSSGGNKARFPCSQCDMKFINKQLLMRHHAAVHSHSHASTTHTEGKFVACKFCKKKFSNLALAKKHESVYHNSTRHQCEQCASSFAFASDLKKHVKRHHPKCYFGCKYCVRFFFTKAQLEEHGKIHGESEASLKAIPVFDSADVESDKAESMRLAKYKAGQFKFACTVCKKRFHDYGNMCRHRRLAHQRQLLFRNGSGSEGVNSGANSPADFGDSEFKYDLALLDIDPTDYFFSNVARNISDNLNNFVEGKPEHVENCSKHVKWKQTVGQSPLHTSDSSDSESHFLHRYNFPKGMKLQRSIREVSQEQKNRLATVDYHKAVLLSPPCEEAATGLSSEQAGANNQVVPSAPHVIRVGQTNLQASVIQSAIRPTPTTVSSAHTVTSTASSFAPLTGSTGFIIQGSSIRAKSPTVGTSSNEKGPPTTAIKISVQPPGSVVTKPTIYQCAFCKKLFKHFLVYQDHMFNKHRKTILKENRPRYIRDDLLQKLVPNKCTLSQSVDLLKRENDANAAGPLDLSSKPNSLTRPTSGLDLSSHSNSSHVIDLTGDDDSDKHSVQSKHIIPTSSSVVSALQQPRTTPVPPGGIPNTRTRASSAGQCFPNGHVHRLAVQLNQAKNGTGSTKLPTDPKELRRLLVSGTDSISRKCVCLVCGSEFGNRDALQTHQDKDHPNVLCTHVEVEPEHCPKLTHTPSAVGLLNVCSAPIPIEKDVALNSVSYTCTKCGETFTKDYDLHSHIFLCAKTKTKTKKKQHHDMVRTTPPQHHRKHPATPSFVGKMKLKSCGDHGMENALRASKAILKKVKRKRQINTEQVMKEVENQRKRRRTFDLQYNPNNHVRRREMTEIVDMQRCSGCGERFSTISKLERHVRSCSKKDQLKEIKIMKPVIAMSSYEADSKRLECVYCQKNFTYLGSLRKHILDVCVSRRELLSQSPTKLHRKWEDRVISMATSQSHILGRQSASLSPTNGQGSHEESESTRRRKRSKRKKHGWGWIKKRKASQDPNGGSDPEAIDAVDDDGEDEEEVLNGEEDEVDIVVETVDLDTLTVDEESVAISSELCHSTPFLPASDTGTTEFTSSVKQKLLEKLKKKSSPQNVNHITEQSSELPCIELTKSFEAHIPSAITASLDAEFEKTTENHSSKLGNTITMEELKSHLVINGESRSAGSSFTEDSIAAAKKGSKTKEEEELSNNVCTSKLTLENKENNNSSESQPITASHGKVDSLCELLSDSKVGVIVEPVVVANVCHTPEQPSSVMDEQVVKDKVILVSSQVVERPGSIIEGDFIKNSLSTDSVSLEEPSAPELKSCDIETVHSSSENVTAKVNSDTMVNQCALDKLVVAESERTDKQQGAPEPVAEVNIPEQADKTEVCGDSVVETKSDSSSVPQDTGAVVTELRDLKRSPEVMNENEVLDKDLDKPDSVCAAPKLVTEDKSAESRKECATEEVVKVKTTSAIIAGSENVPNEVLKEDTVEKSDNDIEACKTILDLEHTNEEGCEKEENFKGSLDKVGAKVPAQSQESPLRKVSNSKGRRSNMSQSPEPLRGQRLSRRSISPNLSQLSQSPKPHKAQPRSLSPDIPRSQAEPLSKIESSPEPAKDIKAADPITNKQSSPGPVKVTKKKEASTLLSKESSPEASKVTKKKATEPLVVRESSPESAEIKKLTAETSTKESSPELVKVTKKKASEALSSKESNPDPVKVTKKKTAELLATKQNSPGLSKATKKRAAEALSNRESSPEPAKVPKKKTSKVAKKPSVDTESKNDNDIEVIQLKGSDKGATKTAELMDGKSARIAASKGASKKKCAATESEDNSPEKVDAVSSKGNKKFETQVNTAKSSAAKLESPEKVGNKRGRKSVEPTTPKSNKKAKLPVVENGDMDESEDEVFNSKQTTKAKSGKGGSKAAAVKTPKKEAAKDAGNKMVEKDEPIATRGGKKKLLDSKADPAPKTFTKLKPKVSKGKQAEESESDGESSDDSSDSEPSPIQPRQTRLMQESQTRQTRLSGGATRLVKGLESDRKSRKSSKDSLSSPPTPKTRKGRSRSRSAKN